MIKFEIDRCLTFALLLGMEQTIIRPGRKNRPLDNPPNRLRELRLAHGLTLEEVAAHLGVKPPTVHQAETEGTGIDMDKWFLLADLFQIDPRSLCRPPQKNFEKS